MSDNHGPRTKTPKICIKPSILSPERVIDCEEVIPSEYVLEKEEIKKIKKEELEEPTDSTPEEEVSAKPEENKLAWVKMDFGKIAGAIEDYIKKKNQEEERKKMEKMEKTEPSVFENVQSALKQKLSKAKLPRL